MVQRGERQIRICIIMADQLREADVIIIDVGGAPVVARRGLATLAA